MLSAEDRLWLWRRLCCCAGTSEGGEEAGGRGADGVRATYQLFQQKVPGLTPDNAPAYFQYLSSAS